MKRNASVKWLKCAALSTLFITSLSALNPTDANAGSCQTTVDANPNIVIPVFIEKTRETSTHPSGTFSFDSYKVKFGRNNEFENICIEHANAVVILRLQDNSGQYAFTNISFSEDGGKMTDQIPQFEIHPSYVRYINKNSKAVTVKYDLTITDKRNGAVIVIDPQNNNSGNGCPP